MKMFKISIIGIFVVQLLLSSCTDDLNTEPRDEKRNIDQLIDLDPNLSGLVSKVYGTLALSGASGPGSTDTPGDDAGESPFLRGIINMQDFTADAMKNRWGDNGLDPLTITSGWDENNKFMRYMYNRIYYTVPQANIVIDQMSVFNISNSKQIVAEMKFLRALSYFYLIDCFGKGPILTEADLGLKEGKAESTRKEIFHFVEKDLLEIEDVIPQFIGYGRTNKAAVRMLLAKLYLNAEVYIGTNVLPAPSPNAGKSTYELAGKYSKLIIDEGGFKLADNFQSLFSGDNDVTDAKNEIIYALIAEPLTSQSYGNTTYLINGSLNAATMTLSDYGATEGWGGHRATKAWYGLFGSSPQELAESNDDRGRLFWSNYLSPDPAKRHSFEMNDFKKWTDGYPSIKFRNTNFINPTATILTAFSGTDFPLYRLADAYLMYAESVLRGGGGDAGLALQYVNAVRTRSNATAINGGQLTLDFILDERARELNFEGHRRTDLIRFGKFTGGSYLWPWKGGVKDGTSIPEHYNLFPIPLKARQANPKLTQNPGYN
jgi:hypothetical protein